MCTNKANICDLSKNNLKNLLDKDEIQRIYQLLVYFQSLVDIDLVNSNEEIKISPRSCP